MTGRRLSRLPSSDQTRSVPVVQYLQIAAVISQCWLTRRSSTTLLDQVSNEFCRLCAKAGPTRCALASNETGLSPEDGTRAVEEKVRAVIHNLYDSPLPIVSDSNGFASFVTASDAYYFVSLCRPLQLTVFPRVDSNPSVSRLYFFSIARSSTLPPPGRPSPPRSPPLSRATVPSSAS